MKKSALATCIALLCVASLAYGQAEVHQPNALGLGFGACTTVNPVGIANSNFACETETANACRIFRMSATFVSSITDPAFAGSTTAIDVLIGSSATVGQWWAGLQSAGCRPPAMTTLGNARAAGTCALLYAAGFTLPGQQPFPGSGSCCPPPNRIRIISANSVTPTPALTTGTRYVGQQLELKTEGTLADCDPTIDPTPLCTDGCSVPACFVLNELVIFMEVDTGNPNPDIIHYTHDGGATRNFVTYQSGTGANCPGATPTRSSTWGAVKALYR